MPQDGWYLTANSDASGPRILTAIYVEPGTLKDVVVGELPISQVSLSCEALLESLHETRTLLIEHGYFDLDSRSEDAFTLEYQFRFSKPMSVRLHLFSGRVTQDRFADWCQVGETDLDESEVYLGYIILRERQRRATVGRTLVRPRSLDPILANPSGFPLRIRTIVQEELNLYGVTLKAEGVPFMQQDGALTSCAHVTAWMAHYTAVHRGLVARLPIAAHVIQNDSHGRQFPTQGMADQHIASVLSNVGLAPDYIQVSTLAEPEKPRWYDRQTIHDAGDSHDWLRERLIATIARYLNSGLPVIFAQDDHVRLVCGYLRGSDLQQAGDDPHAVTALIVHDESLGPYGIVPLSELLADDGLIESSALFIPLPSELLLSGEHAEAVGAKFFRDEVMHYVERPGDLPQRKQGDLTLDAISRAKTGIEAHSFAVRSFASFNSDYKYSVRRRSSSGKVIKEVCLARLPRYVWVVEILDRAERTKKQPAVVGQVVIDATATDKNAMVLMVNLPGYLSVKDAVSGVQDGWTCDIEHVESGRWAHNGLQFPWDEGLFRQRQKSARGA